MRTRMIFCLAAILAGLAACGRDEPPPKAEDTIVGGVIEPLNRAKKFQQEGFQQDLDQHQKDLDQAIQDSQ